MKERVSLHWLPRDPTALRQWICDGIHGARGTRRDRSSSIRRGAEIHNARRDVAKAASRRRAARVPHIVSPRGQKDSEDTYTLNALSHGGRKHARAAGGGRWTAPAARQTPRARPHARPTHPPGARAGGRSSIVRSMRAHSIIRDIRCGLSGAGERYHTMIRDQPMQMHARAVREFVQAWAVPTCEALKLHRQLHVHGSVLTPGRGNHGAPSGGLRLELNRARVASGHAALCVGR